MEKTIAEQLTELKTGLETFSKTEIKASVDKIETELKAIETKADKTELEKLNTTLAEIKADLAKNQESVDKVLAEQKHFKGKKEESKTFNDILAETIERNADAIRNFRRNSPELRFDLLPEVKKDANGAKVEVKVVGDMTVSNNFPAASTMYQDVRGADLIMTPYNRVWLSDIIPTGSSTGTNVVYPKENGGEGAAALWTDYTANKAQIDYDLTSQTAYFKWIAGWVVVQRDMLDDIPWMQSYLQNKMLISLKTAENDLIINGSADTNPVQGLQDVAAAYDGTYTNGVDRIIDAAWGQIPTATNDFYQPTHAVVYPRDKVRLGLNKATGSGEYDLPEGSVVFVNGQLQIGGLSVVGTTAVSSNTFYTFDNRALMFIRRIQPELRMFEDATLAKKNQVMFRIEERATLICFNNDAVVKGVLIPS